MPARIVPSRDITRLRGCRTTAGTFSLPLETPRFHAIDRDGEVAFVVEGRAAGTQGNLDAIRKLISRPT
jgi:hypothetical protein